MSTSLQLLPLDILLRIFVLLSVKDLDRVGRTCKDLLEATEDRSVWIQQNSFLRHRFRLPSPSTLSTGALGHIALRDAMVWDNASHNPGLVTKIECLQNVSHSWLFLGGEFLLLVYQDGKPEVRAMKSCGVVLETRMDMFEPVPTTHVLMDYQIAYSSENQGCFFSWHATAGSGPHKLAVFTFHTQPGCCEIKYFATVVYEQQKRYHGFGTCGDMIYFLCSSYSTPPVFFIRCLSLENLASSQEQTLFELQGLGRSNPFYDYSLVMISPRRFLVAGSTPWVAFYELPDVLEFSSDLSDEVKTPITPMWFTAFGENITSSWTDASYFTSNLYYCGWDRMPTLELIQDHNWTHVMRFSESGDPAGEFTRVELPLMRLNRAEVDVTHGVARALILRHFVGTSRNLWLFERGNVSHFKPIALGESWGLEGCGIDISTDDLQYAQGDLLFDEISGLFSWTQSQGNGLSDIFVHRLC